MQKRRPPSSTCATELGKAIDELDEDDQRRRVWHDLTKTSTQFVGATPSRNNAIINDEYWQVCSDYYGVPSLVFARMHAAGKVVGRSRRGRGQGAAKVVDPFGDNVATAQGLKGDTWRTQHDTLKWVLFDLWREFEGKVRCEVYNLFAYLLEDRDAFDRLTKRKRQGLVPDLMTVGGGYAANRRLNDVKTLHRGSSTYKASDVRAGARGRAVERRGNDVHTDYVRKAKKLDREYGAPLAEGETGPVEAKLAEFGRIRGFVFGAVAESSPDVEAFIDDCAVMGAERKWRSMGARSVREARGLIRGMCLETIGIAAARAAARCKLDRANLMEGNEEGSAAQRRRDRFNYDEQRRYRRNLDGHRRARRFDGPQAHRRYGD